MNKIQSDDIIIRKAILHILDSESGYIKISNNLLDLGEELNDFFRNHIFKIISGDDAKHGVLSERNSPVLGLLEQMDERDDDEFIEATKTLAENLFDIMCDSVTIPPADLICVTFQLNSEIYFALLKMNYKENYAHKEIDDNTQIFRVRAIQSGNAKITEAAVINLMNYSVLIKEKRYEMLDGDKINYLSERFLQCYADTEPKKKFNTMMKVVSDIYNHGRNVTEYFVDKEKLREEFEEKNEFRINEISDALFGNDGNKKAAFDEKMELYDMQYDKFSVQSDSAIKKLDYYEIETDTGIQIKIPAEIYEFHNDVEIHEGYDGTTITIRNIESMKAK